MSGTIIEERKRTEKYRIRGEDGEGWKGREVERKREAKTPTRRVCETSNQRGDQNQ